jgi:hypothetical protein
MAGITPFSPALRVVVKQNVEPNQMQIVESILIQKWVRCWIVKLAYSVSDVVESANLQSTM